MTEAADSELVIKQSVTTDNTEPKLQEINLIVVTGNLSVSVHSGYSNASAWLANAVGTQFGFALDASVGRINRTWQRIAANKHNQGVVRHFVDDLLGFLL